MQLSALATRVVNQNLLAKIIFVASSAVWLVACERSAASSASKGDNGRTVREMVQIERTEPAGAIITMTRQAAYEGCTVAAKMLNIPVKPFPDTPADYVSERTTVISDGTNYVRKVEHPYNLVGDKMVPESGCEFRIEPSKQADIFIFNDGKSTSVSQDSENHWHVEEGVSLPAEKAAQSGATSAYSEALTVNGVKLRCLPASDSVMNALGAEAMCIDGSAQPLTTDGKPVVLYFRGKSPLTDITFAYVTIQEPVSLKQLDKFDSKIFDPATYTK
ncbi:hypothetical protein [Collimonas sp.]|jgi:hypothetical protein|uniref:hypothetical protein n=1 Tax=Collimonas sp. TaxID=1963772 RepID=UPI002B8902F8|nr:hypothetical protein [Collimonas sp.]HWW05056.1 hypothetical protein [Collimonas sp.]